MTRQFFATLAVALLSCSLCHGQLWVDFNSNQDGGGTPVVGDPADATNAEHNEAGYSSYHAGHEVATDFVTATYSPSFAVTGAATVTLTPAWPNTTDNRVQQSIDRGNQGTDPATGFDASWNGGSGPDLDLLTDFIGIDTRTGNGGNGDWDGTTGTPTYISLTLGGLPAETYSWTSFHHDTEHVWAGYTVEISTDGGASYGPVATGNMSSSTGTGNPVDPNPMMSGTALSLSSTYSDTFVADGTNDVVLRYGVLADTAVHRQIFAVNGFQLNQVPEPGSMSLMLLAVCGLMGIVRRRK